MTGIELKKGCIIYYHNKIGYMDKEIAKIDENFKTEELLQWLHNKNTPVVFENGIYDKLMKGDEFIVNDKETVFTPLKKCRIWQLKSDFDFECRFASYDEMTNKHGVPSINNYVNVFDRRLETNDLEQIYTLFNTQHPQDFTGHSLSMSDVVELYDDKESSYHYVDRFGFKEIAFNQDQPKNEITEELRMQM